MFYVLGAQKATEALGLLKTAGIGTRVKSLMTNYRQVPAARTEIQRHLLGALGGGVAGGASGAALDDDSPGRGALIGALLGAGGGALAGRLGGRALEARVKNLIHQEKSIPFGVRSGMKSKANTQLIPRLPPEVREARRARLAASATAESAAPSRVATKSQEVAKGQGASTADGGVRLDVNDGLRGDVNIPPEVAAQMRAAGMLP